MKTGNIRNARTKGRVRAAHCVNILPFFDDDCEAEDENGMAGFQNMSFTITQLILI